MRIYQLCQDIPSRSPAMRDEKTRGGSALRNSTQELTIRRDRPPKTITRSGSIADRIKKFESEDDVIAPKSTGATQKHSLQETPDAQSRRASLQKTGDKSPDTHDTDLSAPNESKSPVPLDSSGRPMFGLAALRRSPTSDLSDSGSSDKSVDQGYKPTTVSHIDIRSHKKSIEKTTPNGRTAMGHGIGPTDGSGKPLFGLAALRASRSPQPPSDEDSETQRKVSQKSIVLSPVSRRESQESFTSSVSRRESQEVVSRRASQDRPKSLFLESTSLSPRSDNRPKSFLQDHTPVSGVQDVLERMRGEDRGDSNKVGSEQEARSLLNKFLGAQVLLQGIDPIMANHKNGGDKLSMPTTTFTTTTTTTTKSMELNEVKGVNINEITDVKKLQDLLEQCEEYEDRKKIRARIRAVNGPRTASKVNGEVAKPAEVREPPHSADDVKFVRQWMSDNFSEHKKTADTEVTEEKVMARKKSNSISTTSVRKTSNETKVVGKVSPFDKFKQMDAQQAKANPNSSAKGGPLFKFTQPGLTRSASDVKDMLLYWCQCRTRSYKNVKIENFSSSWSDGLAFCALIHHFYPAAFDYDSLSPSNRRHNFELAFSSAEEQAGIYPLLDVEDMVRMKKPDWKCVFTYVQSIYRRLKDEC